jgi:hypothetical protein
MDRFREIMLAQENLLRKTGYDEAAFNGNTGILKMLEALLDKAIYLAHKSLQSEEFHLPVKGWSGFADQVQLNLHYQYDPETKDLVLKALTVRADQVSRTMFITKKNPLPAAQDVLSSLLREGRQKTARRIFHRAASSKWKGNKIV